MLNILGYMYKLLNLLYLFLLTYIIYLLSTIRIWLVPTNYVKEKFLNGSFYKRTNMIGFIFESPKKIISLINMVFFDITDCFRNFTKQYP